MLSSLSLQFLSCFNEQDLKNTFSTLGTKVCKIENVEQGRKIQT